MKRSLAGELRYVYPVDLTQLRTRFPESHNAPRPERILPATPRPPATVRAPCVYKFDSVVSVIFTGPEKVLPPVTASVLRRVVAPVTSRTPPRKVERDTPRPPFTCREPELALLESVTFENVTAPTKFAVLLKVAAALNVDKPPTVNVDARFDAPVTPKIPETVVEAPANNEVPATTRLPKPLDELS